MDLYLLRHGIPVEPEHWAGDDSDRPLTPGGRDQARSVIQALVGAHDLLVDTIWTSPYVRADQTARIAAEILGEHIPLLKTQALASGKDLIESLPKIQEDPSTWPARILCVGHQPDLGDLIATLTGEPDGHFGLGRSGSAYLTGEFAPGGMQLQWLMTAEQAIAGRRKTPTYRY